MKKSFIFALFGTTCALIVGAAVGTSNFDKLIGTSSQAEWVHYAQKDATPTEKGIREYWVQCGGAYQFTAPTGATIREATQYDTSGFDTNDDRWLTYVSGSVFYNMAASDWDYREVGTTLDGYTAFNEVDKTTYGAKLNAVYTKAGSPSLMVEQLTISKFITTNDEFINSINCISAGVSSLSGYWVLANDLLDPKFDKDWVGDCWGYSVSGTFDGRGHTIIKADASSTAGFFGANVLTFFKFKNLNLEEMVSNSVGILGWNGNGITFEDCRITGKSGGAAPALIGRAAQNVTFNDCYIDYSVEPTKRIIGEAKVVKFNNTKIRKNTHAGTKLFDKLDEATYVESYDEKGVTWVDSKYISMPQAEANFATPAHGDGYYCEHCGKYFTDAAHKTEIAKADFFTGEKLPSTHVDNKQIFFNLTTQQLDLTEVPSVQATDLVNAFNETPSFVGLEAGDARTLYTTGETNYEYDVVVVSNVIASEADWNNNLSGVSKDVFGYYVLTADIASITTLCGANDGSSDHLNYRTRVNVTIDGRNHVISSIKVTSKTGGVFATCGVYGNYFLTIKNLTISSFKRAQYGFLGYQPANGTDNGNKVVFDNFNFAVGEGWTNGVFAATNPSAKFTFKDCRIDMRQGATKLFNNTGTLGATFQGTNTILVNTAWDANATNCCEIVKGNLANERDGLVSKITNVVFAAS